MENKTHFNTLVEYFKDRATEDEQMLCTSSGIFLLNKRNLSVLRKDTLGGYNLEKVADRGNVLWSGV